MGKSKGQRVRFQDPESSGLRIRAQKGVKRRGKKQQEEQQRRTKTGRKNKIVIIEGEDDTFHPLHHLHLEKDASKIVGHEADAHRDLLKTRNKHADPMFYVDTVLSRKGKLALVWLAAHWEKKLSRSQIVSVDLGDAIGLFPSLLSLID